MLDSTLHETVANTLGSNHRGGCISCSDANTSKVWTRAGTGPYAFTTHTDLAHAVPDPTSAFYTLPLHRHSANYQQHSLFLYYTTICAPYDSNPRRTKIDCASASTLSWTSPTCFFPYQRSLRKPTGWWCNICVGKGHLDGFDEALWSFIFSAILEKQHLIDWFQ
jgi:hypothetical protein